MALPHDHPGPAAQIFEHHLDQRVHALAVRHSRCGGHDHATRSVDYLTHAALADSWSGGVSPQAAFHSPPVSHIVKEAGLSLDTSSGGYARQSTPGVDARRGPTCLRFATGELLRLAADHDPGFDRPMFAEALRAVRRFPNSAFEPYKLIADQVDALHARLLAWADEVDAAGQ